MEKFIINNIGYIITIVGFLITFFITKYSCKKDIDKIRKEKMMEKIQDVPMKLLDLMYSFQKNNNPQNLIKTTDEFAKILHSILSYCGNHAVKIISYIQENSYNNTFKKFELLSSYSILVSQLKYDLIGEFVSPEFYFKIKIKDYNESMKSEIKSEVNIIVRKLDLSSKLLIK